MRFSYGRQPRKAPGDSRRAAESAETMLKGWGRDRLDRGTLQAVDATARGELGAKNEGKAPARLPVISIATADERSGAATGGTAGWWHLRADCDTAFRTSNEQETSTQRAT